MQQTLHEYEVRIGLASQDSKEKQLSNGIPPHTRLKTNRRAHKTRGAAHGKVGGSRAQPVTRRKDPGAQPMANLRGLWTQPRLGLRCPGVAQQAAGLSSLKAQPLARFKGPDSAQPKTGFNRQGSSRLEGTRVQGRSPWQGSEVQRRSPWQGPGVQGYGAYNKDPFKQRLNTF